MSDPCPRCQAIQQQIDHLNHSLGICEQARDEAQARAAKLDKGVASLHEALEREQDEHAKTRADLKGQMIHGGVPR